MLQGGSSSRMVSITCAASSWDCFTCCLAMVVVSFESAFLKGTFLPWVSVQLGVVHTGKCMYREVGSWVSCRICMTSYSRPSKKRLCRCFVWASELCPEGRGFPVMQVECWKSLFRYQTSARYACVFGFCVGDSAFVLFESCPTCVSQMCL